MALPSDLPGEVVAATEGAPPISARDRDRARQAARRIEALNLRLYGLTYAEIGERLDLSPEGVADLINRTLERAENVAVDQMREIENRRLDRAQLAIWTRVLQGDIKAVDAFLRISSARRQMNGLNAPTKVEINLAIKHEMEKALSELEALVLKGEIVPDPDSDLNPAPAPALALNTDQLSSPELESMPLSLIRADPSDELGWKDSDDGDNAW